MFTYLCTHKQSHAHVITQYINKIIVIAERERAYKEKFEVLFEHLSVIITQILMQPYIHIIYMHTYIRVTFIWCFAGC